MVQTRERAADRTSAPAGGGKPALHKRFQRREAMVGLLFVLPALLLFLAFRFGPAIAGLLLSFFNYSPGGPLDWTGLDNFRRMAADQVFWRALRVTVVFTVLSVPITLFASVSTALLVRRMFRGVRFFRSVLFLPVITSLVVAGSIFSWVFSDEGPMSTVTRALGIDTGSWVSSPSLVIPALVIVSVWSRFGYGMLIVLAQLQGLPRELEEAALTDGAGPWHRFRYIVLPQLRPALFFLAVIETTASFQVFDLIYVMTQGGPARASYTLVYDLYDQGFKYFNLGYASVIGVALFVMTLVVALIQRTTFGRDK